MFAQIIISILPTFSEKEAKDSNMHGQRNKPRSLVINRNLHKLGNNLVYQIK